MDTKKSQIIDAAIKMFSEKGFYQTGMRDIAKEADVAIGTIYHHFQKKDNILIYILREAIEDRREYMEELRKQDLSIKSKIKAILKMHFEKIRARSKLGKLILSQAQQPNEKFRKEYKNLYNELAGYLEELIEEGLQAGVINKCHPPTASYALLGALDFVMLKALTDDEFFGLEFFGEVLEGVIDLLWRGLGVSKIDGSEG